MNRLGAYKVQTYRFTYSFKAEWIKACYRGINKDDTVKILWKSIEPFRSLKGTNILTYVKL